MKTKLRSDKGRRARRWGARWHRVIFTLDLALKGLKTREWFRKYTVIQKKVF